MSAWYTWAHLFDGWVAQDDGTLAMGALRVLHGQLPHRDYLDNYTGGLSLLLGFSFRIGGVSLDSLRLCVFLFFLVWLAAVFYIARRMAPPLPAAAAGLVISLWGFVQYPAAMPSWFNLFLAGLGAAALLRYLECRHRRWLFLAGMLAGLSILVKIIGVYYVAAALLFLVFHEQQESAEIPCAAKRLPSAYAWVLTISLVAFEGCVLHLVWNRLDAMHLIDYVIPAAALCAVILRQEWSLRGVSSAPRFQKLFALLWPFAAGAAIPIAAFLVPYVRSHCVGMLVHNVLGALPSRIGKYTALDPVDPHYMFGSLAIVLLLSLALFSSRLRTRRGTILVLLVLAAGLLWVSRSLAAGEWSNALWGSVVMLTPLLGWAGCALLMTGPRWADALTATRRAQIFLLLALAVMCSFVQFPFPPPIYFSYTAPCTLLAAFALCTVRRRVAHPLLCGAVIVFFAVYAVTCVQPARLYAHWYPSMKIPVAPLNLPRAGRLRVELPYRYQAMIPLVRQHAAGRPIIATPECPEIYFLAGATNIPQTDAGIAQDELMREVQSDAIPVVVINLDSIHTKTTLTPELKQQLQLHYPNQQTIDRYIVYWR